MLLYDAHLKHIIPMAPIPVFSVLYLSMKGFIGPIGQSVFVCIAIRGQIE